MLLPHGLSSRPYAQRRAVAVLPVPGASIFTGVSSAKTASPARTWRPMASARGSNRAVDLPTQAACQSHRQPARRACSPGQGSCRNASDEPNQCFGIVATDNSQLMTARDVDLNHAVAGCGIDRKRRDRLFGLGLVNNLNWKIARFRANRFSEHLHIWRELGIAQLHVGQIGVHRVPPRNLCNRRPHGTHDCRQIETFSSSDQNRFF